MWSEENKAFEDEDFSEKVEGGLARKPPPKPTKTWFQNLNIYFSLFIWFMGYSFSTGHKSVVIPAQVKLLVPPESKEFYNGIITLPSTISAGLFTPLAGAISDSLSTGIGKRHPVMMFGSVLTALISIISAFFIFPFKTGGLTAYILFTVCVMILEAGFAISLGGYSGLGSEICREKLGVLAALMSLGRSLGTFASLILYGFILQFVPYPLDFILSYGVTSVYLIFSMWHIYTFVPEKPYPKSKKFVLKQFITSFWIPFWNPKYRNFCFVFVSRLFFEGGISAVLSFIEYFIDDVYQNTYSKLLSSLALALLLLCGTIIGPVSAVLSDKYGRRWFVIIASTITSFTMFLVVLLTLFKLPLFVFFILAAILGFGVGVYLSLDWALAVECCPDEDDTAKDLGIWCLSSSMAQLIAPFITGVILNESKKYFRIEICWSLVFGTSATYFLLSGFFILFINIKSKSKEEVEFIETEELHSEEESEAEY